MAYIQNVRVELLAGRRVSTNLHLNRDVNVFFGANGSGKTSLLRILHSGLSGRAKNIRKVAFGSATLEISEAVVMHPQAKRPYYGDVVRTTAGEAADPDQLALSPELQLSESGRIKQKKIWRTLPGELAEYPFELRHTYLPISRLYVNEDRHFYRSRYEVNAEGVLSEMSLEKIFTELVNTLWLRYTRNSGLEIQVAQSRGIGDILAHFLTSDDEVPAPFETDISEAYGRLQTFLERQSPVRAAVISREVFERRIRQDPRMQLVLRDIENIEREVERIKRPRNEFNRVLKDLISGEKQIQLADRDIHAYAYSEEIQLEDLSSGEKQLLRICIDVLLADGQPILIDEPELSMHIDWQRRLIPSIRALAPASQLIVATHSPEIVASVQENQIFEL